MTRRDFIAIMGVTGLSVSAAMAIDRPQTTQGAGGGKTPADPSKHKPGPVERPSRPEPEQPGLPDTGGTRGDQTWFSFINRWFHSYFGS